MTTEVWNAEPGRATQMLGRASAAARIRWDRFRDRLSSSVPQGPGRGPVFAIGGFDATFEELARVIAHPAVSEALNAPPIASLVAVAPPPIEWPRGAERFGGRPRSRPARVYDVVPFAFELDLLELRLLTLDHVVDQFVVVESASGFGGVDKGVRFDPSAPRFARFAAKIRHLVIDPGVVQSQYPDHRRRATDFRGEDAFRAAMWRTVREAIAFDPDAVVISADLDEFPPPHLVDWLRHHQVDLPWRLDLQTLRYSLRWRDTATPAQLVIMSPADFDAVDAAPHRMRHVPGRLVGATGAVHLTSFLRPLGLIAKFAATTDWDPGILAFLRNEHDETERMIAAGRWFGRRLAPYDPDRDPERLVPWAALAHRARFARFWDAGPAS